MTRVGSRPSSSAHQPSSRPDAPEAANKPGSKDKPDEKKTNDKKDKENGNTNESTSSPAEQEALSSAMRAYEEQMAVQLSQKAKVKPAKMAKDEEEEE